MRDLTEQLKPFIRSTYGWPHYSPEANEFLKTIEPADDEIIVYKMLYPMSYRAVGVFSQVKPEDFIPAKDDGFLASTSFSALKGFGLIYQQGKITVPILSGSRIFAYSKPEACKSLTWRCLAPKNSKFVHTCSIPFEGYVRDAWDNGELVLNGGYVRRDVMLCDSVTVLDFLGDYDRIG